MAFEPRGCFLTALLRGWAQVRRKHVRDTRSAKASLQRCSRWERNTMRCLRCSMTRARSKNQKCVPLRSPAGFYKTLHVSLITLFSQQLANISHVQLTCRINNDKDDFERVKHFHIKFHTMTRHLPVPLLPSRVVTLNQMFPAVLNLSFQSSWQVFCSGLGRQ